MMQATYYMSDHRKLAALQDKQYVAIGKLLLVFSHRRRKQNSSSTSFCVFLQLARSVHLERVTPTSV